jgi:hypothetical protein
MARTPIIGQSQQNRAPRAIMVAFEELERVADAAQSLASAVNAVKIAEENGNRIRSRLIFSVLGDRAGEGPGHPPTPVTIVNFCSARRQGWIDAMKKYVTGEYLKATPRDDVIQNMGSTVDRAINHEYPLQDKSVRDALCEFAFAERTNDYRGEDTSGTQIGNHTGGGLRGLGFSDY